MRSVIKALQAAAIALLTLASSACTTREVDLDVFLLVIPSDSAECGLYAEQMCDIVEQEYDLDVLEEIRVKIQTPFAAVHSTTLVLDEFLSIENREKILRAKLHALVSQSSDKSVSSASVTELVRNLGELFVRQEQPENGVMMIVGRFPQCYRDSILVEYYNGHDSVENRPTLHWIVPGARENDVVVRQLLGRVFNVIAHPLVVPSYDPCLENAVASSGYGPPVIVVSFITESMQVEQALRPILSVSGDRDVIVIREGIDTSIRVPVQAASSDPINTLRSALIPSIAPRWNSVNYLLKRGFASAARFRASGVLNPVLLIVGSVPDQAELEVKNENRKGVLLDSTDFRQLPDSTSFAFLPMNGGRGRTMRALQLAVSKYGFRTLTLRESD